MYSFSTWLCGFSYGHFRNYDSCPSRGFIVDSWFMVTSAFWPQAKKDVKSPIAVRMIIRYFIKFSSQYKDNRTYRKTINLGKNSINTSLSLGESVKFGSKVWNLSRIFNKYCESAYYFALFSNPYQNYQLRL